MKVDTPTIYPNHALRINSSGQKMPKMPKVRRLSSNIESLPSEILALIFSYLSAKRLSDCRKVCHRWKNLIDGLESNGPFWRNHCKTDFPDIYLSARTKARISLTWFDLYKSLTLWSKLPSATVVEDEFSWATYSTQTNLGLVALHDGIVGVHTRTRIIYYDTKTLKRANIDSITGNYLQYQENYESVVLLSANFSLQVIRKLLYNPHLEGRTVFGNVKLFQLCEHKLYYVTITNDIYLCDLTSDRLTNVFLTNCPEEIMCLNYYSGSLYILTFKRNIFKLWDKMLSLVASVGGNILDVLRQHGFLENLDWRVYHLWIFGTNPNQELNTIVASHDVTKVRNYGEVTFVGTRWGIFQIYFKPYVNGVFDCFRSEIVKQWNFMERLDCPVLSFCPIIDIDVIETDRGHRVFVVMPKKIVILNLQHELEVTPSSRAIIPYDLRKRL